MKHLVSMVRNLCACGCDAEGTSVKRWTKPHTLNSKESNSSEESDPCMCYKLNSFFSLLHVRLMCIHRGYTRFHTCDDCIDSDIHGPQQVKEYAIDFFLCVRCAPIYRNVCCQLTSARLSFRAIIWWTKSVFVRWNCVYFQHHFMFLQYYHRNCAINAKQMRSKFSVYTAATATMATMTTMPMVATIDSVKSLMLGILSSKCVAN